jgi:putative transposase
VSAVYRECQDAVLHRLELTYGAFFGPVKKGETPGFPRFKSFGRWNHESFPHGERALRFDATREAGVWSCVDRSQG